MDSSFAIVGATLIDGTGIPPLRDSVVMVSGDRIAWVGCSADISLPEHTPIVDGAGKTLLPGLVDAHTHVGTKVACVDVIVDDKESFRETFLSWFPAHGITTVRCTGMPDTTDTFWLLKRGRPHWPRFFSCGQAIDGVPGGRWPGQIAVADEEEARRETQRLLDLGVDFVKTYYHITPAQQRAIVDTAHTGGRRVATHAGYVMTVEETVLCGVDAVEHVRVGRELVPEDKLPELEALPPRKHDQMMGFRAWRYIDPTSDRSARLIELLVERGVFLTPTLAATAAFLCGDAPDARNPDGMADLPLPLQERWHRSDNTAGYTGEDFRLAKVEFGRVMEWVGLAHRAGVPVSAGTDTPSEYLVPGRSLHVELELLVKCGLSPLEAIVSATRRPAELLNQQHELGTIEEGRYADLVLLARDPLTNIRNIRSVEKVWKGGMPLDATPIVPKGDA